MIIKVVISSQEDNNHRTMIDDRYKEKVQSSTKMICTFTKPFIAKSVGKLWLGN